MLSRAATQEVQIQGPDCDAPLPRSPAAVNQNKGTSLVLLSATQEGRI